MTTQDLDPRAARYREKSLDLVQRKLLITRFTGSEQERDLREPSNCGGFGRIRHFRRETSPSWPSNPLPLDPACRALGLPRAEMMRVQVFQNSVCNWRCWYCFVDFALLRGDAVRSDWMSAEEMLRLYLAEENRPLVLDLTGGQPDLTPEWVPWMMEAITKQGLAEHIYLWSDDNLSNDYFWRFLPREAHQRIAAYRNYGRVGCFKGFDAESFAFNTGAAASLFDQQFDLMGRLIKLGLDAYAYVTLTTPNPVGIADGVRRLLDRLQALDSNLPLRTVPLEVRMYSPVEQRNLREEHHLAMQLQWEAIMTWQSEIEARFAPNLRGLSIAEVQLEGSW